MTDGHWPARRDALLTLGAALAAACSPRDPTPRSAADHPAELTAIEATVGGRVGVFALDTGSGRAVGHREGERFAMCSVFKWILAAAVLQKIDRGEVTPGERVAYGKADLLEYAPVTTAHVDEGAMTVEALMNASVTLSDNTAANLLLPRVGGPDGVTRFIRQTGDRVTRLDRSEPSLNSNEPGDVRDTTSPRAMVDLLRAVLLGDVLSPASREALITLMKGNKTGDHRLRAGLPAGWTVGDKTGTGDRGAFNDVAIVVPPGRAPVLIAAFLSDAKPSSAQVEEAYVALARLVAARLG